MNKTYKTKVSKCGYEIGTTVVEDLDKGKRRSCGQINNDCFMVRMPSGGSLFYTEEELQEVK